MARFGPFLLLFALLGPASAEEGGAPVRFSFVPASNGVFRLDAVTGEISLCMERNSALVCLRAPAAAAASATGVSAPPDNPDPALERRVAALEARAGVERVPRDSAVGRVRLLAERMIERVAALVREMRGEPPRADL